MQIYRYGMKYRPFGIGCQPIGHADYFDTYDEKLKGQNFYYGIVTYNRELSLDEINTFELECLNKSPRC